MIRLIRALHLSAAGVRAVVAGHAGCAVLARGGRGQITQSDGDVAGGGGGGGGRGRQDLLGDEGGHLERGAAARAGGA